MFSLDTIKEIYQTTLDMILAQKTILNFEIGGKQYTYKTKEKEKREKFFEHLDIFDDNMSKCKDVFIDDDSDYEYIYNFYEYKNKIKNFINGINDKELELLEKSKRVQILTKVIEDYVVDQDLNQDEENWILQYLRFIKFLNECKKQFNEKEPNKNIKIEFGWFDHVKIDDERVKIFNQNYDKYIKKIKTLCY